MSRIALLGGSFNPPHICHQIIALWVLSTDRADQVWLIPCLRHPFGKQLVEFSHRLEMCRLAAESFPTESVHVSAVERDLDGDNRTLHTIEHLLREHPDHSFSLVIGSDILAERASWHRFDRIEELVEILVVGRAGYASPDGGLELPNVSSSAIRQMLADGDDPTSLVPAAVLTYIGQEGFYQSDEQ
jgi:nicotinate-nucleotide adenylyltransferase